MDLISILPLFTVNTTVGMTDNIPAFMGHTSSGKERKQTVNSLISKIISVNYECYEEKKRDYVRDWFVESTGALW